MSEYDRFFSKALCYFRWSLVVFGLIYFQCYYNASHAVISKSNITNIVRRYNFHRRIMSYERFMSMNSAIIDLGIPERVEYNESMPVCRRKLSDLGPIKVNKSRLELSWVEQQLPHVRLGGYYAPTHCRAKYKTAIFIPYRNRSVNLAIFLYYMHRLWKKQLLHYRVFVIEQYGNDKFNKGSLYNIAFIESQRFGTWDCLYFHDVDLIPMDERVLYTCPSKPTHVSAAVESTNFQLLYETLFGGVTVMSPKHFVRVNGYSNYFWNWGAEDDDMAYRLEASRLSLKRLNLSIARFTTLPHEPQEVNENRFEIMKTSKTRFREEGLKSLQYRLIDITKKKLFTHVIADVNPFNYENK